MEDDASLRELLVAALTLEGFRVEAADTGRSGLECARSNRFDLLLLDVGLPDVDGFTVSRRLRQAGQNVPVIYLTARVGRDDLRQGLGEGGDDYVTKPFLLEELVLRIGAVLRRAGHAAVSRWSCGDLEMDDERHHVTRAGQPVQLSATEYRLLRHLLHRCGRVVSKATIREALWGFEDYGDDNLVEAHMSQLRRKVDFGHAPLLHTVRGFGYVVRSADGVP